MQVNEYKQNREVSWLHFNERVMDEAAMPEVPLLEKLKFLSIFTSNLDEFFMVRVGSLHDLTMLKKDAFDNKTGMSAEEQLETIYAMLPPMYEKRDALYDAVWQELMKENILIKSYADLNDAQKKYMHELYVQRIQPMLSPQVVDLNHPFPFLENKRLYVFVELEKENELLYGLIPIRESYPSYVAIPGSEVAFVLLEDIILEHTEENFDEYQVKNKAIISVTRNFDFSDESERVEEFDDYQKYMKNILKKRKRQDPVRLETQGELNNTSLKFLLKNMNLGKHQHFNSQAPLRMDYIFSLIDEIPSAIAEPLLYKPFHAPEMQIGSPTTMIEKVRKRDRLLCYPFDDMQDFITLLKEAATDPNCVSIKITIYRLAKHSQVVRYLMLATENGKEVTVLMELQARFDEESNINYANMLYEAGCNVIYGFPEYKTHSKVCLITFRDEKLNTHFITQIGTGNYNESTARQYTDFSLLTANREIGLDANDFFRNMSLGKLDGKYKHLLQAPTGLKQGFLKLMDAEIAKGEDGYIFAKFNSLSDIDFIEKLAEASQAGVKVDMCIRGICCLLPGIPGVTENIEIHSVVGRFLEHTRLYMFGKGEEMKMYISSADLMTRNMNRRVEIAAPIYEPVLRERLLEYKELVMKDNLKGRIVRSDGTYGFLPQDDGVFSSQDYFIEQAETKVLSQLERARELKAEKKQLLTENLLSGND